MNCGIGHRRSSDPMLLWLQCRLAATAPIGPLAWELPYAVGADLKKVKKKKKEGRKKEIAIKTIRRKSISKSIEARRHQE